MTAFISHLLDRASDFFATRKGLLPILGIILIIINFILVIIYPHSFFSRTNIALHFGIILAIIGQLLAWAL